jgi:putative adenylate-forming enzyme
VPWPIAWHFLAAQWRWRTLRRTQLASYQDSRARKMVRFAATHAPFYRGHWAGYDLNAWQSLPPVDKPLMMNNFNDFNTRGIKLADAMGAALQAEVTRDFQPVVQGLTVGLSSGTSGHRGLFVVSPAEQAAWAGTILARALPGLRLGAYRVALFLRSNSNLYERTSGRLVHFRYFDLMTPLADAVSALNRFQPDIILAPPSLLLMLAAERNRGGLHGTPALLISVAEVLEPQDEQTLRNSFGVPVHQIYQCTEGLLAVSCSHGSLHIQEDLVFLQMEPVAGDSERVMPVVTDLHRTTQPIIRYRLGDLLRLDPQTCACGSDFRVIQSIEGRSDDVFYFEAQAGGLRPFFPDTLRRAILLASDGIADYRVYQLPDRSLRVHLEIRAGLCFDEAARAVCQSLTVTISQYDCKPVKIALERGLPASIAGSKRRRVQRLV